MRHTLQKIEEAFLRYGENYVAGQTPEGAAEQDESEEDD